MALGFGRDMVVPSKLLTDRRRCRRDADKERRFRSRPVTVASMMIVEELRGLG
jgi:hypothetical protein